MPCTETPKLYHYNLNKTHMSLTVNFVFTVRYVDTYILLLNNTINNNKINKICNKVLQCYKIRSFKLLVINNWPINVAHNDNVYFTEEVLGWK